MSVQTNLSAAIDADIQSTFAGTLAEISASKINLESLLKIQQTLANPSGAQTVVLSTFRATAAGPGYSVNDIIILRQTAPAAPEYLNATTNAIIATPNPANLGAISTASNVSVTASVLPASAATSALQTSTQNAVGLLAAESGGNLAGINNKLPSTLGAKTAVNSVSFTPATDAIFTVSQAPVVPAFLFTSAITRVANVTPYAANTVYGGALQLISSPAPIAGQWVVITDIDIIFNFSALPPGMAGFKLYLYQITPPSAVGDTGAYSLPPVDRASIIYYDGLSIGNAKGANGAGSVVLQMNNINVAVPLNGTSFFAYLVSINPFTPAAASETATIRVRAIAL